MSGMLVWTEYLGNVMKKLFLYLLGCTIFSIGATSFILSNLGTDPLDVFSLGVRQVLGWNIGTTQSVFAIGMLVTYCILEGIKLPPISPLMTLAICGYSIDILLKLCASLIVIPPTVLLVAGITSCTVGSAFIIMSSFGVRPMDIVAISLMRKTGKPFWLFKGIVEIVLLCIGFVMGGPVGVGTLAFLVVVGFLIQPAVYSLTKLGIPNFSDVR